LWLESTELLGLKGANLGRTIAPNKLPVLTKFVKIFYLLGSSWLDPAS
jgi:hypothetical protein